MLRADRDHGAWLTAGASPDRLPGFDLTRFPSRLAGGIAQQGANRMPSVDSAMAFELGDSLFAAAIEATRRALGRAVLVGLCGSQASGKSTTAVRLVGRLAGLGARAIVFSIDDFYLTLAERRELA